MNIHWHLVHWGTVPEYLTALPIIFAAALYKRQLTGLDVSRRALLDQQAHCVTVWSVGPSPDLAPERADDHATHAVTIDNSGTEAVYDVTVVLLVPTDGARAHVSPIKVLAARSRETLHIDSLANKPLRLEITFMDSRGNHWARNNKGRLRRVAFASDGGGMVIPDPKLRLRERIFGRRPILQKDERPAAKY
jgi:hypothetical protein